VRFSMRSSEVARQHHKALARIRDHPENLLKAPSVAVPESISPSAETQPKRGGVSFQILSSRAVVLPESSGRLLLRRGICGRYSPDATSLYKMGGKHGGSKTSRTAALINGVVLRQNRQFPGIPGRAKRGARNDDRGQLDQLTLWRRKHNPPKYAALLDFRRPRIRRPIFPPGD